MHVNSIGAGTGFETRIAPVPPRDLLIFGSCQKAQQCGQSPDLNNSPFVTRSQVHPIRILITGDKFGGLVTEPHGAVEVRPVFQSLVVFSKNGYFLLLLLCHYATE